MRITRLKRDSGGLLLVWRHRPGEAPRVPARRPELKEQPLSTRGRESVALIYDPDCGFLEPGEPRASLAYDPVRGELAWWIRRRSGTPGETVVAYNLSEVLAVAAGDQELEAEINRVTKSYVARARRRVRILAAGQTDAERTAAKKLKRDLASGNLRRVL